MSWDSSDSTVNNGEGVNEWNQADLQRMLNTYYIGIENATCTNSCNDTVTPINSIYKSMIETVKWNTGAIDGDDSTIVDFEAMTASTTGWYNAERGTVGKTCTEGIYCTDEVTRTTTWEGLVALPYGSDYVYATSESACHTNMLTGLDEETYSTTCKNNNWMHYGTSSENSDEWTWFLSPIANPDSADAGYVSFVDGGGFTDNVLANSTLRVRPTLYLKSNIQIKGGDGSVGNAYKLN